MDNSIVLQMNDEVSMHLSEEKGGREWINKWKKDKRGKKGNKDGRNNGMNEWKWKKKERTNQKGRIENEEKSE